MEIETADIWISKLSPNEEARSAHRVYSYRPPLPHP